MKPQVKFKMNFFILIEFLAVVFLTNSFFLRLQADFGTVIFILSEALFSSVRSNVIVIRSRSPGLIVSLLETTDTT